jgi:hypothetical protein
VYILKVITDQTGRKAMAISTTACLNHISMENVQVHCS